MGETLVHRWFEEVWNKGSEQAIYEMFAEDGIAHSPTDENGNEIKGPAQFAAFHQNFRAAFPNIQVTVEETVTEGDKIAALCSVTGTHTGDGIGYAATHKPVQFSGLTMVRIKDGKIIEAWNHFDFMKLYQQIDAVAFK